MEKVHSLISLSSILLAFLMTGTAAAVEIVGAGASLPDPIYKSWSNTHGGDLHLVYQAVGSGSGVDLLIAGKVDFGASDRPMKPEELEKNNLVQFPAIIGAVVPVVNIEGIEPGRLKLDGETLAKIYLGKIAKWNDPAIVALNRDLKLPDANIAVIYRSDSSGSTFLLTNYLSKASAEWRNAMGEGTKVNWKTGTGGLGSTSVIGYVQRLKNSIGYVDFNHVVQNGLSHVQLKSRDGQFVSPSVNSIKAAAANAQWGKNAGFYEILTDQQGSSWPITGASFVLMHKVQNNPQVAQAVLKFFDWSYINGTLAAERLSFVSLPANTQQLIRAEWKNRIKDPKGNPVW
jgi:phosphate transport system substrate-binding protein